MFFENFKTFKFIIRTSMYVERYYKPKIQKTNHTPTTQKRQNYYLKFLTKIIKSGKLP